MNQFWILILVSFFATNSPDKTESVKVKLEKTPLKTFDEIFGEGWWDKDEAEDLKRPPATNFGQNVHHQIDRQNTQIGQIEPNLTDQNPPLIESDHSVNAENSEEQNEIMKEIRASKNIAENERKHKIVDKFHAIKEKFKLKGKYSKKEWVQIEEKIAKHLKANRKKIYIWKKGFGISRITPENDRKHLVEKFVQMKAELKRDGFKNSHNELDKTVAKELGLSYITIYKWKRELGQSTQHKHPHSEQKELMKRYYEIKDKNSKIRDEDIAKMLKIGTSTLIRWKRQFKQKHSINGLE